MKKVRIITLILIIPLIGIGQIQKNYQIGEIKNWAQFLILTEMEIEHHQINEKSYRRKDSLYRINKAYLPTVPEVPAPRWNHHYRSSRLLMVPRQKIRR